MPPVPTMLFFRTIFVYREHSRFAGVWLTMEPVYRLELG